MKLKTPAWPAWVWVMLAALAGSGAVLADVFWPRVGAGPPLEARVGFYAAAGFAATLIVLIGAWGARFLRDGELGDP